MGGFRGGGGGGLGPAGKSQVANCFLRSTGTDPLEKQLDPRCNCRDPIASRGRSVRPSVKL